MKEQYKILLGVTVFFGLFFFVGLKARYDLQKNPVVAHALIREIKFHYKGPEIVFVYTFSCNGEAEDNSSSFNCSLSKMPVLKDYFLNKEFPMVYDGKHCYNNLLLFDMVKVRDFNVQPQLTPADYLMIKTLDSIKNN